MGDPADLMQRRCATDTGIQLHPHDVLRATLAGHVRRVVINAAGVTIDQGRKHRFYTGVARDAVKLLVRHCQRPGCDLPADICHVDHNTEWVDDGRTDQVNGGVECGHHNVDKHRHKRRRRRAVNGYSYTVRTDGTIMSPVGARPPRFVDEVHGPDRDDPDHDWWNDCADDPDEIARHTNLARQRLYDTLAAQGRHDIGAPAAG